VDYFFIKKKDIDGNRIIIKGSEFRHIKNVLRAHPGDPIVLISGDGDEYHACISEVKSTYIFARITKITRKSKESGIYVAIAIAPPKAKRMEWFVEKATELGVSEIIPIITKRSVVVPGSSRMSRWKRVAIAAVKQAERSVVPNITDVVSFEEFLQTSISFTVRFIAYEKQREGMIEEILSRKKATKILAVIGPEGGFEEREIKAAVDRGFVPVTLGTTKLRTETAGIVALSRILAI